MTKVQISSEDLPIRWHTPPNCQCQTLVYEYGMSDGVCFMRISDKSSPFAKPDYYISDLEPGDPEWEDWDPANSEPDCNWNKIKVL